MGYFLEPDGLPVDEVPPEVRVEPEPVHDNCYRHNIGGMYPCPWGD